MTISMKLPQYAHIFPQNPGCLSQGFKSCPRDSKMGSKLFVLPRIWFLLSPPLPPPSVHLSFYLLLFIFNICFFCFCLSSFSLISLLPSPCNQDPNICPNFCLNICPNICLALIAFLYMLPKHALLYLFCFHICFHIMLQFAHSNLPAAIKLPCCQ